MALTYKLVANLNVLCPMNPPNWFVDGVCFQLIKNSAPSVIKVANGSLAVVKFDDNMSQTTQLDDMVLVTGGADVGVKATLLCFDGNDLILKESNESYNDMILFMWHFFVVRVY